ncbi:MAG: DUF3486 family protein [Deltaproteobacteria bacterium]|nr:DUF3486 family protein [Deltaproteobacteria bacterium]
MSKNRSHSSIAVKLAPEDIEGINIKLATPGVTYGDIVRWLAGKGYTVSKSSVGRYGKDFLARIERLKVVEEKAKAIVSEVGDALTMEEAASKIFTQKVLEHLLQMDDLSGQKFGTLMMAFSKLQGSSVIREKLQADIQKKASAAADTIKQEARKGGLSEEVIKQIEERVLGIVR